ncbi:MAG: ABC transporter ATP-binding protein [Spirochaetes bacterium]|nr:ABC transporter ATP-binding protein [Spirochaetota bacterium]
MDLAIKKGEIFGLLGPNGAGKTTTLSMISGLLKPTAGKIDYAPHIKGIKSILGYVPQDLAIYPRLTARENLAFFGRLYHLPEKKLKNRIEDLLELIGLKDRGNDLLQSFSLGMLRRINLAIGLMNEPAILLLDEPTVGIDPQSRNCIYENILTLKKIETTILYTTHYMEEAENLCDRIAIIDFGKIIALGTPFELIKRQAQSTIILTSKKDYHKDFLAQIDKIENVFYENNEEILKIHFDYQLNAIKLIESINELSQKYQQDIRLLKIEEASLENLFLQLTGREFRDE